MPKMTELTKNRRIEAPDAGHLSRQQIHKRHHGDAK